MVAATITADTAPYAGSFRPNWGKNQCKGGTVWAGRLVHVIHTISITAEMHRERALRSVGRRSTRPWSWGSEGRRQNHRGFLGDVHSHSILTNGFLPDPTTLWVLPQKQAFKLLSKDLIAPEHSTAILPWCHWAQPLSLSFGEVRSSTRPPQPESQDEEAGHRQYFHTWLPLNKAPPCVPWPSFWEAHRPVSAQRSVETETNEVSVFQTPEPGSCLQTPGPALSLRLPAGPTIPVHR